MAMRKRKIDKCKVIGAIIGVATVLLLIFAPLKPQKTTFVTVPQYGYTQQKGYVTMKAKELKVKATAYANDPITYTGTKPQVMKTIAVDPSVIPLGSKVYIPEFDRVFIAEDTGGKIKGDRIDIYMQTESQCKEWGIRDITIYILEN